jgi:hypothetical protein
MGTDLLTVSLVDHVSSYTPSGKRTQFILDKHCTHLRLKYTVLYVYVCVCVCKYIYICVCVCVCVWGILPVISEVLFPLFSAFVFKLNSHIYIGAGVVQYLVQFEHCFIFTYFKHFLKYNMYCWSILFLKFIIPFTLCVFVCMCICMRVYIYVCVYVYIYIIIIIIIIIIKSGNVCVHKEGTFS